MMTDLKAYLARLHENLNTLREREAKYAGNPPLNLLNEINDHEEAIALTEQAIVGELSEVAWERALQPLLISLKVGAILNKPYQINVDESAAHQRAPLRTRIPEPRAVRLVGRTDELDWLCQRMKTGDVAAIAGVRGLGGIGKTELAIAAVQAMEAHFEGRIIWLDCGPNDIRTLQGRLATALGIELTSDDNLYLRADSLALAWRNQPPILVVFDDLRHDHIASFELIAPKRPPCALLVTSRRDDLPLPPQAIKSLNFLLPKQSKELLSSLLPKTWLDLESDTVEAVAELLEHIPLALTLAARRVERIARRRDNSSKYPLSTLLKELQTRRSQILDQGERADLSVAITFDASYEDLEAEAQFHFLCLGLSPNSEFSSLVLQALFKGDKAAARRAMQRLSNAGLIEEIGSDVWWMHDLLREYVSERLTPQQRRQLHEQIGVSLEHLNLQLGRPIAPADELAYHFSLAGNNYTEKAISYRLIAVDNALQVYASEAAAKHYQMALDLLDEADIPRRVWILEQLGDLYFYRTRQIVDAVAPYEWAIQLWQKAANPDPPALIRLYRKMGEIARYWQGGHMEQVDTYLIEAIQLLDEDPSQAASLERARTLAAMAFNLNARGATKSAEESALNLAQKAAQLAKRLNAADEETTALDALQRIYRKRGDLDAAHEIDRRRLDLIPRLNNPTEAVDANLGASQMGWETGDLAAATEFCLEALTLARRTDNIGGQWETLRRLVMLHLQWGRLPNAVTYARQGVELGPRAGSWEFGEPVEALFRTQLAILYTLPGENEAAARELAELSALYPTTDALPYRFALGWLNYENEDWDKARQNLERGHASPQPFLPARFDLILLVEVYGHLGNEDALNQVWPTAYEASRQESPYLLAILNRGLGAFHMIQEEWTDAEAAFKRALAVTHRTTLWYQDARTWLDYGRMLAHRNEPGDLDMARDYLSKAQHMFTTSGVHSLAKKAQIEIAQLSQ